MVRGDHSGDVPGSVGCGTRRILNARITIHANNAEAAAE
jgi:hypothetical protein